MTIGQLARISGSGALVLMEAQINESGPLRIHLKGRKIGLIAWILARLGLDDTTTLDVYENKIVYSSSSLSGKFSETIPLSSVSNVGAGFLKPFLFLFLAILFALGFFLIIPLVFAAIFGYLYWSRKSLLLYVIPNSGSPTALAVKRSLIEYVSINQETADRMIKIIEELVEANTAK